MTADSSDHGPDRWERLEEDLAADSRIFTEALLGSFEAYLREHGVPPEHRAEAFDHWLDATYAKASANRKTARPA